MKNFHCNKTNIKLKIPKSLRDEKKSFFFNVNYREQFKDEMIILKFFESKLKKKTIQFIRLVLQQLDQQLQLFCYFFLLFCRLCYL